MIDWDAVGAIATAVATIVALFFGLKDSIVSWIFKQQRQKDVATAMIHPVQVAMNQCVAIMGVLEPDRLEGHRQSLSDLGKALRVLPLPSLIRQGGEISVFGDRCSSSYWYAVSLIDDLNNFAEWLDNMGAPNEEQWDVLLEQFAYERECASQIVESLKIVEEEIKIKVPSEIMTRRFGDIPGSKET